MKGELSVTIKNTLPTHNTIRNYRRKKIETDNKLHLRVLLQIVFSSDELAFIFIEK